MKVTFTPRAEEQLAEAYDWYERRGRGLGGRLLDEVALAVHRLERNPDLPKVFHRDTRKVNLDAFPYGVFYRQRPREAVVVAVIHLARNPAWIRAQIR